MEPDMLFIKRIFIPAIVLLLYACGGGGNNGNDKGDGASAPAPTTTPPQQSSTPPPVTGTARSYAYVGDGLGTTVTGYSINSTTGELTEVGSFPADAVPMQVMAHPSGKFVYVTTQYYGTFSYRVDAATGNLIALQSTGPRGYVQPVVAVDASGRFLYLSNVHNAGDEFGVTAPEDIEIYRIDAETGILTLENTLVTGRGTYRLQVPRVGNVVFLYSAGQTSPPGADASLRAYRVDPDTGSLTLAAEMASPSRPEVHPDGVYVYLVTNSSIAIYKFDDSAGTFTPVPLPVLTGIEPFSITFHPNGQFAYVRNSGSHDCWIYRVDPSTGGLTPSAAPSTVLDGSCPSAFDPSGQFAYAAEETAPAYDAPPKPLNTFSVDPATGSLTPVGTPLQRSHRTGQIATVSIIDPSAP
jgi:6-phosphogluconolactonase